MALTAFDPDLPPLDRTGAHAPGTHCAALAIALTPPRYATSSGIRLRVIAGAATPVPTMTAESAAVLDLFGLKGILEALVRETEISRTAFIVPMEAGGRVEVEKIGRAAVYAHRNGDGAALDARLLCPLPLAET